MLFSLLLLLQGPCSRVLQPATTKGDAMITIKTILCPVDFFPASDAAVMYAASFAGNYDAVIHLLHVITPVAAGAYEYAIDTTDIMKAMEESATREVTASNNKLKEAGVSPEFEARGGDV